MITLILINSLLAAAVFTAVILLLARGIRPVRAARPNAPVRIVTFNAPSMRERRALAEGA